MAFVDEFKELAHEVELGLLGSPSQGGGSNLDQPAGSRARE
jgi:hypothetical protein